MARKTKTAKGRLDKYYHLAKEQGFRSRAAFKLIQLNKKYDFLGGAHSVIDLCAAPGSWMQVAAKYMPVGSTIVGVDLASIRPIRGGITLMEDITTPKCRTSLKKHIALRTADVVLHDGAPNVGMSWAQDAYSQSELVLAALKLASEFLRKDGIFISKVFRSQDYNSLLAVLNQLFKRVEATKPVASRNTSAEIFVICTGYKAPKSVDAKLLDPKHVFKMLDPQPAPLDIFAKKQPKRKRDGYEEGNITQFKRCTAADFIASTTPIISLATYSCFTFDDAESSKYKDMSETTSDVVANCTDLKVLGKKEFKELLKWRLAMRSRFPPPKSSSPAASGHTEDDDQNADGTDLEEAKAAVAGATEDGTEGEKSDEKLMDEMGMIADKRAAKEKSALKRAREKRAKYQKRVDMAMVIPGDRIDVDPENDLFSLSDVVTRTALDELTSTAQDASGAVGGADSDEDEDDEGHPDEKSGERSDEDSVDSEEESNKYGDTMADYFDKMYEEYMEVKCSRTKRKRIGKKEKVEEELPDTSDLLFEKPLVAVPDMTSDPVIDASHDEESNDGDDEDGAKAYAHEEDEEEEEEETNQNPLLMSFKSKEDVAVEKRQRAALWFSQPIFAAATASASASASAGLLQLDPKPKANTLHQNKKQKLQAGEEKIAEELEGTKKKLRHAGGSDKKRTTQADHRKQEQEKEQDGKQSSLNGEAGAGADSDSPSESDSDSDIGEGYDSDDKMEILAVGTAMNQSKKERDRIMDDAYNRYAFSDRDNMPKWFAEEERQYSIRQMPVTKEIVEQIRERFKAIDARPIKKIAEAKARRKRKAVKKLEALRAKATGVSENSELSESAKAREINKLLKQGAKRIRPGHMNAVGGGRGKGGAGRKRNVPGGKKMAAVVTKQGKTKLVDSRAKKDKRGQDRKMKNTRKGQRSKGKKSK